MPDVRNGRISRELFLAAIAGDFGTVEPWVMDRLTGILEEEEVTTGDCIYAAGDPPDYFYVARQGRVELVREGKPVETIVGPRAFGMLDALIEHPRSHSAYAPMPLQLAKIRMDGWLELLEDSFELARMSIAGLVRGVSTLEERLWRSGRHPRSAPPVLEATGAPLDVVERVAVLMSTPALRGAGVQPLSDLAAATEEVVFPAGDPIFARGAPPGRVLVIIDGRVEGSRESPAVTWNGGPGQMVCGVVSLGAGVPAWEAHAATRVRCLEFGIDDWFDVMEENFEMVRATLAALATEHELLVGEL
jgi:CRP-like cAMP-binding protein